MSRFATGTASNFTPTQGVLAGQIAAIVDPNPASVWFNAGYFPPQYIQIQLPTLSTVTGVYLHIDQFPDGQTHHQLFAGPTTNPTTLVTDMNNYTYQFQWINLTYSPPLINVQFLLLKTNFGPSWVSWRKFLVYGA